MFILKKYLASKSSAGFREEFSKGYLDKQVSNETVHRLITRFRDIESVCDKCSSSDKTDEIGPY
jgi:hypothetical protein